MKKLLSAAAVAAAFLLVGPGGALAGDTICEGGLGAGPYDNVIVPAGAICALTGTTVNGSVKVEPGASLHAFGAVIYGNLQSDGASIIYLVRSTMSVTGDTQLKGTTSLVQIMDSTIAGGSLQVVESDGAVIHLLRNKILLGNLEAVKNVSWSLTIAGNTIGGNLHCKENFPDAVGNAFFGPNMVSGNTECEGL